MNSQNYNYITCYRRKGNNVFIYLKNGSKFSCSIRSSFLGSKKYLDFPNKPNDYLFRLFKIDKELLIAKLPGTYYNGNWPESKTEEELFDLLRVLIKESKKIYALKTEL